MHREAIRTFVYRHEDLIQYRLTDDDWTSIVMVTDWLQLFQLATTQMSATKTPMLSSTHAIFRGLQGELREILRKQKGLPPRLVQGIFDAHLKLSEYYYKFDESPFYLWASRTCYLALYFAYLMLNVCLVLDPRISYSALFEEFEGDGDLAPFLQSSKDRLHTFYTTYYANKSALIHSPDPSVSESALNTSLKKSFTARFRKPRVPVDELHEFWKLPREDFDTCNPIKWWLGRQTSFPNLYRLACDILSIPGAQLIFLFPFLLITAHYCFQHLLLR
jgi:hypothetical protein